MRFWSNWQWTFFSTPLNAFPFLSIFGNFFSHFFYPRVIGILILNPTSCTVSFFTIINEITTSTGHFTVYTKSEAVELRHAPFILWIEDLAVMDPYFVLPILMAGSMYFMQTLNPQIGDPMQIKMMKAMPLVFGLIMLWFPAGLVLYWLVNNLLSIAQQWYVIRQTENARAVSKS